MKEVVVSILLSLCLLPSWAAADGFDVEGRVGYFYPMSKNVREIYPDGMPEYQIEASYLVCCPWSVWANVGYMTKRGHSEGFHDPARITMVPIAVGGKFSYALNCDFECYLGLGASYSILRIHDESPYVDEHVHKNAFGVTAKSGLLYRFWSCWFIEGFIDYNYTKFNFSGHKDNIQRNDLDMSGFLFGGGIGLSF